jgi:HK97 family phage portal protein
MLDFLNKFLSPPIKAKQYNVTPNMENLLNRIIWGQFVNDLVVWYDGNQLEFINKGYQGNATVYAIVNKIANKASTVELNVFKPNSKSKQFKNLKQSGKDLDLAQSRVIKKGLDYVNESDDFYKLLRKPNKMQTFSEFLREYNIWKKVTGEVFIYGVGPGSDSRNFGKYTELVFLPSHLVELKLNTTGINLSDPVLGYKLSIGDQFITIPKEDVLHIKETNLTWDLNGAQLRGMPPLLAGKIALQKSNSGMESGAKSNENQGAKGIVSPNITNPELFLDAIQREKLDQQVELRVNGKANRDKVVTSGLPLQYTQIGLSPVAMDLIAGLQYDDEKLCGIFGVHPVLFRPTATRAELEVAQKALVTDVVIPELNLFEEKLAEWLNPKYKTNYKIDFDTSSFPELQPDLKLIMDAYKDKSTITTDELRVMLGFDEIGTDAAKSLWISNSFTPLDEAYDAGAADFGDFTGNNA